MPITCVKKADGSFVITLEEKFDFHSVKDFRRVYEAEVDGSKKDFAIDFQRTRFMDSSALGMLINMKKFWDKYQGSIRLINTSDALKKILIISRFDKMFPIE